MRNTPLTDEEFKNWRSVVKCNWLKCYAGLGLAGHGTCFACGNPRIENCPEFKDEDEFVRDRESNIYFGT